MQMYRCADMHVQLALRALAVLTAHTQVSRRVSRVACAPEAETVPGDSNVVRHPSRRCGLNSVRLWMGEASRPRRFSVSWHNGHTW